MYNFIQNHKVIVYISVTVLLIGFAYISISSSFNNKSATTTAGDIQISDSDQTGPFTPFSNSLYSININPNTVNGVPTGKSLIISAPTGYQSAAVQQLYTLGIDPTNYKIVFNQESPFTPYE